ncbi:MAG: HIT family protein [Phaeodactylibacter sp.]|nr:HIT family protein [Phaeodactylibacter sp.]
MPSDCIFCRVIEGSLPSSVVYEDEQVVAFMDIMPVNPGHVLVVPRKHCPELQGLDEETGAHLFRVAMRLERALRASGLPCEGTNLLQNNGAEAWQEVMHVHLHVIPRFRGDGVKAQFGQQQAPRADLDQWAEKIKAGLPS